MLFQCCPQLISPLDEWDIKRVLEIRLTNDARQTVRGAEMVGRLKTIEAQNPPAAGGEMVGGGASHRPQPDNDYIVSISKHSPE